MTELLEYMNAPFATYEEDLPLEELTELEGDQD